MTESTAVAAGPTTAAARISGRSPTTTFCTANDEQLGNFPQAFSHIGLITAANAIDKAREAG